MKQSLLCLFLFLNLSALHAQSKTQQELNFVEHLVVSSYYNEAQREIERLDFNNFSIDARDSLNYYMGWSLYSLKQLNLSTQNLLKVGKRSSFYPKSHLFAAYNQAHLGNYTSAHEILKSFEPAIVNHEKLTHFLNAGISLLERDYLAFETSEKLIESDIFTITKEREKLKQYAIHLQQYKTKKPWVAGVMSAIIPGSGKIYAGKTGEGIASLLMVSSMGLVTWENYRKAGPTHFKTILFGSIFSIFYVGNIYGSVFSVKIKNEEFNHEMDQRILFNLHIPLRNFFN